MQYSHEQQYSSFKPANGLLTIKSVATAKATTTNESPNLIWPRPEVLNNCINAPEAGIGRHHTARHTLLRYLWPLKTT